MKIHSLCRHVLTVICIFISTLATSAQAEEPEGTVHLEDPVGGATEGILHYDPMTAARVTGVFEAEWVPDDIKRMRAQGKSTAESPMVMVEIPPGSIPDN